MRALCWHGTGDVRVDTASITGPPTGSSSAGLMTGMPMTRQGTPS
jgi:hypothetical protein